MLTSRSRYEIKWFIGVVTTIAAILGIVHFLESIDAHQDREPASSESQLTPKQRFLRAEARKSQKINAKGNGIVDVLIDAPGKERVTAGSVISLEANVEAMTDVQGLKYSWILPDGISAAGGALEGDIGNLTKGETTKVNLSVVSATAENRQVHLHVYKNTDGGEKMGTMGQYNTVDQENLDAAVEAKAERLDQDLGDRPHKVYQ